MELCKACSASVLYFNLHFINSHLMSFFVRSLHSLHANYQHTINNFSHYCNIHACDYNTLPQILMPSIDILVCNLEWPGKWFNHPIMSQCMISRAQSLLLTFVSSNITSAFGVVLLLSQFFNDFGKMENNVVLYFLVALIKYNCGVSLSSGIAS